MSRDQILPSLICALFALGIFMTPSQPARAGSVFFCTMNEHIGIQDGELIKYTRDNFRMQVTERRVKFGAGGAFNNYEIDISIWVNEESWQAASEFSSMAFSGTDLTFAMALDKKVVSVYATCDKF